MKKEKRFISLNREDGKDVRLLIDTKNGLLYSPKYHNDNIIGKKFTTKDISNSITSWEDMEDIQDYELEYLLPKEYRDDFFHNIDKKFLISSGDFCDIQLWGDGFDIEIFKGFVNSNIKKFSFNPNTKAIFNPEVYNHISEVSKHKDMINYTNSILEKIDTYSKLNTQNLSSINNLYSKLSDINTTNNMREIKIYLLDKFDFSLSRIKKHLINYKNQSIQFIEKLESEDDILNFVDVKNVDFNIYCETITNKYNSQIKKIEEFNQNKEFLEKLLTQIEVIFSNSNNIHTAYKSKLLKKCEDEYVDSDFEIIFTQFVDEIDNIDNRYFEIIKNSFNNNLSEDVTLGILKSMIKYQKDIENHFISDRISIIQEYSEKKKSNFLQKVDTENSLFNFSIKFIEDMKKIIKSIDDDTEKQIINEIIVFLTQRQISLISSISEDIGMAEAIQSQFLKLEKQNFEIYLDDIKLYSEALEKRDKEIKSLMFKMKKDLERES